MRRQVALLAALFVLAHCSKGSSSHSTPAAPAPAPKVAAAEPTPAVSEPTPAAEERPLEITEGLVEKYLVYMKESVPARNATFKQYGDELAKLDKEKGLRQGVDAVKASEKYQKAFEELEQSARAKAGLSAEEMKGVSDAVSDVIMPRMVLKEDGREAQFAAMETQMKAALAQVPPEQRAEAEKELKQATEGLKNAREATEARKKYGDKAVEAILKHEAELVALQKQALSVGQKQ